VNTSPGISRSEVGRCGVARGDGRKQQRSAGAGGRQNKQLNPTWQRDEREAASSEDVNHKGKRTSVKTRPTRGLGGPAGVVSACGGSEASGLAGPKAEWAATSVRPKVRKKNF
jgi:hypothetical protein